jgi:hypothetical protein
MELQLNTPKIKQLLKLMGKNQSWLATQIGVGRQWVSYDMRTGCTQRIRKYALVFGLDAKDLIK